MVAMVFVTHLIMNWTSHARCISVSVAAAASDDFVYIFGEPFVVAAAAARQEIF